MISLTEFPIVFGRGESAHVKICDRWASRLHCEISLENGQLILRDLNAKHGTTVNGERVHESVLTPGDVFTVGLTAFRVVSNREGFHLASESQTAVMA